MIRKKKLKIRKIILVIIFLLFLYYLYLNYNSSLLDDIAKTANYNFKTIKEDNNENYSGIGQERIRNKDGYFTVFTTEEKNKKTYIEYKQNGNASWAEKQYWGGTMIENGCGIVTMSIILSGYNKNFTPENLRQKYYPSIKYDNLSKELSSVYGLKNSDFYYDSTNLSSDKLVEHLVTNRPIIICVWNKPNNNRWTTSSHYMALLASDGGSKIYVSNPNGGKNDSKSSGWYELNEVVPYIAKALYIEEY